MHEAYPVCVEQIHDDWSTVYHMVTTVPFNFFIKDMIFFLHKILHLIKKEVLQAYGLVSVYLVLHIWFLLIFPSKSIKY